MSKETKIAEIKLYISIHVKMEKKEVQENEVKNYYTKVVANGGPPSTQPIKRSATRIETELSFVLN